ncbi:PaaI family thioesterase [Sneathiella sp. HT1-7]|uniref:PaaI family thioesterase n=1 Tax=Sneathiella sp. HT1-7 TaxID=2887192 RepID=UPI001D14FD28|nr:PaaI family thioesterase [Sneathiella sp. HT1-7]MCC3305003.1 PaaI family thioesterase [Sneathiella sp. HT1-7]
MTKTDLTAYIRDRMPLCATLGMKAEKIAADEVILTLDWTTGLCTSAGILHGGAIMALADSAGGAAAFANLPEGASGTSTIESKTNFLGAVREGRVTATAKPLHVGGSTIVIETEVRNSDGKLIGKVTQTQTVLRPRG